MSKRICVPFSQETRNDIWTRYKQGQPHRDIAKAVGRGRSSVNALLQVNGGIQPRERYRSTTALSLVEREDISRGLAAQMSIRAIARQLDRSPSTICREITRNGGRNEYRATLADRRAWAEAKRPKACKLSSNSSLRDRVVEKLQMRWSPQQIAGWLKKMSPENMLDCVSHKTIYKSLFIQARGSLKKELQQYLRSKKAMRGSRTSRVYEPARNSMPDAISIRERPASIEDRAVPGHWEGDLIHGANQSQVATLVERQTRYVMLVKLDNKRADEVAAALAEQVRRLPKELYASLTWDRGVEMKGHKNFTLATEVKVYFCDPRSPWQRGTNENTNGLLREYLSRKADLSVYSQIELDEIARQLNERPRKTLGYDTPAERLHSCVALIA